MRVELDHVQVAIPAGGEDAARAFFGTLIGLVEIPKPDELRGRGGCWFEIGSQQLHLGIDADFRPAKKAHIALRVDGLGALQGKLAAAGYAILGDTPVGGRQRFFSEDPFGNRIEFVEGETTP